MGKTVSVRRNRQEVARRHAAFRARARRLNPSQGPETSSENSRMGCRGEDADEPVVLAPVEAHRPWVDPSQLLLANR